MTSFKIDLEATASSKAKVKIPEELLEAYIIDKTNWTYEQVRQTPQHVIEKLMFLWHLQSIAEEAANRG